MIIDTRNGNRYMVRFKYQYNSIYIYIYICMPIHIFTSYFTITFNTYYYIIYITEQYRIDS